MVRNYTFEDSLSISQQITDCNVKKQIKEDTA